MEFYQTKIRPWIGIIALLFIGIMMIKDPALFNDVEPTGRKAFLKMIFSYIWGIPAGIIAVALSLFLGYKQIKGGDETQEE